MAAAPAAEARAEEAAATSATQLRSGIDASHWQGTINWTRVAGASKKFVYLKATEGTTYVTRLTRQPQWRAGSGHQGRCLPLRPAGRHRR